MKQYFKHFNKYIAEFKSYTIVLIAILLASSTPLFATEQNIVKGDFKIHEIVELEKFYLILGVKDDNVYRILSKKDNYNSNCDSIIRLGQYSHLSLKEINMLNFGVLENYLCSCCDKKLGYQYLVDGDYITLPVSYKTKIYLALNISGKCITNS